MNLDAGMNAYLAKSFQRNDLWNKLRRHALTSEKFS